MCYAKPLRFAQNYVQNKLISPFTTRDVEEYGRGCGKNSVDE